MNDFLSTVEIKIKRFDQTLPLPEYKTSGAVAMDLYARIEVSIESQEIGYVPLNVALQVPLGYWVQISARSSLHKRGLILANGIGVGDYDFRGDEDEYIAPLFNFSAKKVVIPQGERIVQMMILPRPSIILEEVEIFEEKNRGGFGTTGSR
ncbi:MAG: dUTP diphosphatase [Microgenomates group bacterium]